MKQSEPNNNFPENDDYISREEAKEVVKYIPWCDWEAVGKALDELKPADVRPVVRGEWIYEPGHIPRCSVCGRYSDDAAWGDVICCPACGTMMGGQDNA